MTLTLLAGNALAADSVVDVIPLQNRPAEEILPLLRPLLESDEQVVDNGFSLIVKTSPQRQSALRELIGKLDIRLHNLLISVLQNSIKTADELNAETAIELSPQGIVMQGFNGNTGNLAGTRNLQQLRTLEGQAAHIEAGQSRAVDQAILYNNPYGYPTVGYATQMQQASTGFAVIPHLTGNNEVSLHIEPWSERFLRGGGIATSNVNTSLRVRLGEWVEIGGVNQQSRGSQQGYNGLNYQSRNNESHLLLKVDLSQP